MTHYVHAYGIGLYSIVQYTYYKRTQWVRTDCVCGCIKCRRRGVLSAEGEGRCCWAREVVAQSPLAAVQDMRDIACVTGCLVCPVSESQESRNYNNLATGAVLYNEATAAAV